MPRWKDRHGRVRNVSARDYNRNYFIEVCLRDWQAGVISASVPRLWTP